MPLQNIGGDPENEFFSDGLTEDIIAHLSHVDGLRVISRTSVMPFKQTTASLGEIAAALNVGTVLEGSVRRAGERLRVVVQLIDARSDQHLWAETYDRELDDVFAIQSEIALKVADALRASLSPEQEVRIRRRPTESIAAHDLYLLAKHDWYSFTKEGLLRAKERLEGALELDPNHAPAHAGLAHVYLIGGRGGVDAFPMAEAREKARAAAHRAISLDGGLGLAYSTLSMIHAWFDWEWDKAIEVGRMGVEAEPNSSGAWGGYAWVLAPAGKLEESIEAGRQFLALDPLEPVAHHNQAARLFSAHRTDEALPLIHRCLELDSDFTWGRTLLADITLWQGDPQGAVAMLEPLFDQAEESGDVAPSVGAALGAAGRVKEFSRVASRLESWAEAGRESFVQAAIPYIWSGDHDHALELLEKVPDQRPPPTSWPANLRMYPLFDPIREDPRFQEVLRKMGLV